MALAALFSKALKIHNTRELRMDEKEVGRTKKNLWVERKTVRICLVQEHKTMISALKKEAGLSSCSSVGSSPSPRFRRRSMGF